MTLVLGQGPLALRVVLVTGADFVSALKRSDSTDWEVGTAIELEIRTRDENGDTVYESWPAAIAGDTAEWNLDLADVNAVIAARPSTVRLWYVLGELRLLWAQGDVEVI